MKAHKTESCTGEALPSFSNYRVGLHQSHLSPLSVRWVMRWKINRSNSVSTHYYWGDKVGWRLVSRLSRTAATWTSQGLRFEQNGTWLFLPTTNPSLTSIFYIFLQTIILYFICSFCCYTSEDKIGQQRPRSLHSRPKCAHVKDKLNPIIQQ